MVVDIFLAPDDDVLVSVQSRTRRFETASKSYIREVIIASTFCKAMLGYLPLLHIALLGCYKTFFLICSPKKLRKNCTRTFRLLVSTHQMYKLTHENSNKIKFRIK